MAELKQELKLRSLPVSGTKTDLIERLRAYQEQVSPAPGAPKVPAATSILPKAGEVVVAFPAARLSTGPALVAAGLAPAEVVVATVTSNGVVKFGSTGSTPPVSPTPSERSLLSTGDENSTPGDTFGEMVTSPLTQLTLQTSPLQILVKEEGPRAGSCCVSPGLRAELEGRDKDQMLQEKDKQIEELTRMLRQKQQLVEWLRLQLEQEKRAQQPPPAPAPAPAPTPAPLGVPVKQENSFSSCQLSQPSLGPAHPFSPSLAAPTPHHVDTCALVPPSVVVKQEAMLPEPEPAPTPQLLLGPQGPSLIKGVTPPTVITDSAGTHLVLTVTNKKADSPGLASGSPQQVPGCGRAGDTGVCDGTSNDSLFTGCPMAGQLGWLPLTFPSTLHLHVTKKVLRSGMVKGPAHDSTAMRVEPSVTAHLLWPLLPEHLAPWQRALSSPTQARAHSCLCSMGVGPGPR